MIKMILGIIAILLIGYFLIPEGSLDKLDTARDKTQSFFNFFKQTKEDVKENVEDLEKSGMYIDYGMPYEKTKFPCETDIQCYMHIDPRIEGIRCNVSTGNCYLIK